jgi:hypothetical protein
MTRSLKSVFSQENNFKYKILLLAIIYLWLPNNNHLADSYGYGAGVKYGVELFQAHHLLYTWINYIFYNTASALINVDALHLMQIINSTIAIFCLVLLNKILVLQQIDRIKAEWLTLAVGCSFGIIRFAVEAEVYIFPIFFSLLSSYFFLKYIKKEHWLYPFLSGLFATIACLFHQIHLFWGIGLFVGWMLTGKVKNAMLYLSSTPLVLIGYSLVILFYEKTNLTPTTLFHYLANYYYSDTADVSLGLKDILISAITLFRTFYQVHGLVYVMFVKLFFLSILVSIVTVAFVIKALLALFKTPQPFKLSFKKKVFEQTHLVILFIQFSFACFSHGNSEFMVMVPVLIAISFSLFENMSLKFIQYLTLSMIIWNLYMGLLPNHYLDYYNNRKVAKLLHENPRKIIVIDERTGLVNTYFYMYGKPENPNIVQIDNLKKINKFIASNTHVWTGMLSRKEIYNRGNFTLEKPSINLKFIRHILPIECSLGSYYIDEVQLHNDNL